LEIKNKIVVVTGGAHGIGRALCREFYKRGAAGIVVAVDIFCSNAGVGVSDAPSWTASGASNKDWQLCWEVNLMSQVYAARAVLPEMQARGSGHIFNTASAAGLLAQMGDAAYTATKHASYAFSKSLALTHGAEGIGVSVLCPQYVATAMTGIPDDSNQDRIKDMLEPDDVAKICCMGIENNQFLITPHEQVKQYVAFMHANHDKWLKSMQKMRSVQIGDAKELEMSMFIKSV